MNYVTPICLVTFFLLRKTLRNILGTKWKKGDQNTSIKSFDIRKNFRYVLPVESFCFVTSSYDLLQIFEAEKLESVQE